VRIRRVVTGHDEKGKSVFASDEEVEPITVGGLPGAEFHRLWGADQAPTYPDAGSPPDQPTFFPPVGGFRFLFFTLPPADAADGDGSAQLDLETAQAELEAKLPGMASYMEPDDPGMHTTDTIDFEIVISGEVTLELDDGAERTMRAGDTVVQNGTRHRWHNRGTEPVVIGTFIVGANRKAG
jgi:mannose-6-phosphate isomerase-like protein (cupin superfamily)